MVESKRLERLKPRPSNKSARARVNYTLLVLLILFAQSTDLLCSEALERKRGVATDTQGPKTAAHACVRITATNSTAAALVWRND